MSEKNKTFGDLADLCIELNAPDFHVFLSFRAHINSFDLEVHHGGWNEGSRGNVKQFKGGFAHLDTDEQDIFSRAIDWLKERHEENKKEIERLDQDKKRLTDAIESAKKLGLTDEQIKSIKQL